MKLFKKMKDGGQESTVTGYWLIESKRLFSIVLLKFEGKSRQAFHNHAFDAISWVLSGKLLETLRYKKSEDDIFYEYSTIEHTPGFCPVVTLREDFHKVDSVGTTWVLSFRGPWNKTWNEFLPKSNETITLTEGRKVVENRT